MECNKDEALRARNIAEQMMQGKNFTGAKKVVLRAQQLFPGLDSISQMLTVCEVHCAANIKINGETDWYRILQLESTADESYIKQQYRKLALLLHPDKNKFAGAEAAFKLICEANMTLSDPVKRSVYDDKIKSLIKGQPSQQSNKASVFRNETWTTASMANQQSHPSTAFSGTSFQENVDGSFARAQPSPVSGINTKYDGETKKKKQSKVGRSHNKVKSEEPKLEGANEAEKGNPSAGSIRQKRARKIVNSSDSDTNSKSTDNEDVVVEDGIPEDKNASFFYSTNTRRSTRQKRHVTYNENGNEDDDDDHVMTSSNRLCKVGSTAGSGGKKLYEGYTRNVKVQSSRTYISRNIDKQPQEEDVVVEDGIPDGKNVGSSGKKLAEGYTRNVKVQSSRTYISGNIDRKVNSLRR